MSHTSTLTPPRSGSPHHAANFDDLPSPTCGKVLAIMELLAAHPDGISGAAAARLSGITANLVFRILKTLVAQGFCLQQPETKAYRLSSRLLELASPQVGEASLAVVAYGPLCQLRDATGETAQLVIESAGKALVLEQVRGTQPLQVCGQVGMRTPLYSSAPGKAILAWWDEPQRAAWFRSRRLKRFTAATLADRPSLLADLARSRDRGYTVDLAEGNEGIHCVAAPILDPYGQPIAAVTIMAPVSRLSDEKIATAAVACKKAAATIEATLTGRFPMA
jgi:IclR family acetate operon transcriptional repressor